MPFGGHNCNPQSSLKGRESDRKARLLHGNESLSNSSLSYISFFVDNTYVEQIDDLKIFEFLDVLLIPELLPRETFLTQIPPLNITERV